MEAPVPRSPSAGVSIALVKQDLDGQDRVGQDRVRQDRVLLIRRAKPPLENTWSLPGGRPHWGETLWQTAARELAEETGITAKPLKILTASDSIFQCGGQVQDHWQIVTVLMAWQEGEAIAGSDASQVAWYTVDDALAKVSWMPLRGVLAILRDEMPIS